MYLRFTGKEIDLSTGKHKGIFTLAYDLLETGTLLAYDETTLKEQLSYFRTYLPIPSKFSKKKNVFHKNVISTSWFKDSATGMLKKIWELKYFLEHHDIVVEVLQSEKPGYIVYEDEFQIIVDPF